MYFSVISIMPDMFSAISSFGITSRAIETGKVQLDCINPRDFTTDNYHRIDNKPYGGGPGMVMTPEPLVKAIEHAKKRANEYGCRIGDGCRENDEYKGTFCPVVYLSPQGQQLSENVVVEMNQYDGMILLCGRYEGIDERILEQYVDKQISIGDYVLTGGELPAMVLMDSVIRRLPNVMGDDRSAEQDSFVDGLLDCPHYTKPRIFNDSDVPEVLMSGNHSKIAEWRFIQQALNTQKLRPDLWQSFIPTKEQKKWLTKNNID